MKWRPNWHLIQDIAILGTGIALIYPQIILWAWRDRTPSDVLMAWGVGLLTFGAIPHIRTVLGIRGEAGGSSPPSPPPSLPPSLRSPQPEEGSGGD